MKRLFCLVALLVPGHAVAQVPASPITADELAGRLRFFSSDLFLGRRPGTAGEALTTSYLVSELSAFGLRPGANGSWFQAVSIVGHEPVPDAPVSMVLSGRVTATWRHGADLRVANHSDQADVATGGDLVFIGYGITAPVYRWDDLAGADLTGKIAVGLLGEPDADSTIFNGVRASRYSWTRDKEADLERRGAVGVLWIVPAGRMSKGPPGGSKLLAADAGRRRLLFTGTVADSAVAALVPGGAAAYARLVASAGRRGFSALPLGSRLEVRFRTRPWAVTSNNVVATVPGTDQVKAREHIVLSAHWDAYGITSGQVPDSIHNGALDDGSGTTELLALARVFAGRPEPRSITYGLPILDLREDVRLMLQPHPRGSGKRCRRRRLDHDVRVACEIRRQKCFRVVAALHSAQYLITTANHATIRQVIHFQGVNSQSLRGGDAHANDS